MFTFTSKSYSFNNGDSNTIYKNLEFDEFKGRGSIEINKNGEEIRKLITKQEFDKYLEKKGFFIDNEMFLEASKNLTDGFSVLENKESSKNISLEKRPPNKIKKINKFSKKYIENNLSSLELEQLQYNLKQLGITYKSKNKRKLIKRILIELKEFI